MSVVAVLLLLVVIGVLWRPWQHPQSNTTAISSSNAPTTSTPTPTRRQPHHPLPPPPPVTVTAAPTTSTAQVQSGPTIGDECHDWMKFSTDPLSGQEMLCSGYSDNLSRGEPMKWYSAEAGAVGPSAEADAPRVGKIGSSCNGEVPYTMGRSSDGYAVWCYSGPRALMPGLKWLSTPDERSVWALYSP